MKENEKKGFRKWKTLAVGFPRTNEIQIGEVGK